MAQGKNKRLTKGKKGLKKKQIDPLSRKDWYNFKAPVPFDNKTFGYTPVTKSSGTRIASECIKGRVVESSFADLAAGHDSKAWRKVKLIIDDVEGMNAKTTFYGMDITRDKLMSMIKKWQSLIECFVDCKTADGYILRVFVIAFTARRQNQLKKTSYAMGSQIKEIRKKITNILSTDLAKLNINEVVKNFLSENYVEKIQKATQFIYPLQNITLRKVKCLRRPKIDAVKLNELYSHKLTGVKKDAKAIAQEVEENTANTLTAELNK